MSPAPPDLEPLERHLLEALAGLAPAPSLDTPAPPEAAALWRAQVDSRHCDVAARWLQGRGLGFYTIGSAGHESNAAVALALRPSDPALLHYRSGGFYLARAAQAGRDGVPDILLGVTAASDEPIAGGRHKVFGHHDLAVIPQTSTIASHPPRAVGVAFAIERAKKLGVPSNWAQDAVAVCSFGDASVNHATALAGLNTAGHTAHQGLPLPLLFVCEDNGIGISVPTPRGWTEAVLQARPGLRYVRADGDRPAELLDRARELVTWVRAERRPAVLHLSTVRYLGHAGADVEAAYRSPAELRADLDRDPILATGAWLVSARVHTPEELVDEYLESRARVLALAEEAATHTQLASAADVMRPLALRSPTRCRAGDRGNEGLRRCRP